MLELLQLEIMANFWRIITVNVFFYDVGAVISGVLLFFMKLDDCYTVQHIFSSVSWYYMIWEEVVTIQLWIWLSE